MPTESPSAVKVKCMGWGALTYGIQVHKILEVTSHLLLYIGRTRPQIHSPMQHLLDIINIDKIIINILNIGQILQELMTRSLPRRVYQQLAIYLQLI